MCTGIRRMEVIPLVLGAALVNLAITTARPRVASPGVPGPSTQMASPRIAGLPPDRLQLDRASAPQPIDSAPFERHLTTAIQSNAHRRAVYARLSGGKSRGLSDLMLLTESLALPTAAYFDSQAKVFNARGIPIIQDDFVSMSGVKPATAKPLYQNVASPAARGEVEKDLHEYQDELSRAMQTCDFRAAAAASYAMTRAVGTIEESSKSHFAMTRHIVDSIGLASMHAVTYAAMSAGATNGLARDFIKAQSVALATVLTIDDEAQHMQQLGIGMVVNDVPEIPFSSSWERFLSDSGGRTPPDRVNKTP